ncbi:hypothetical protein [Pseudoxanthomonas sp. JBR18]|uniref:hypothetical protein n=1 Tax=Pseudoxanthomonas sp. JBR18 TaxID=2969308 RepID=UPI002306A415|nr:hypothetical protein [Pseudoxanthomonas sp. JBR18]WCE03488.1 hypothetical protein PJ250_15520 [Pseudoxanthomonas sp. JBR18]
MAIGLTVLATLLAFALLAWFALRWRRGRRTWALPMIAVGLVAVVFVWEIAAPQDAPVPTAQPMAAKSLTPEQQAVMSIVVQHCQACHSSHAMQMVYASWVLKLDTFQQVQDNAERINRQVVELRNMPMGNATQMTPDEREVIARWYAGRPHRARRPQ